MSTDIASNNEIANRAYLLWEQASRPQGRDLEFWLQAENDILAAPHSRNAEIDSGSVDHVAREVRGRLSTREAIRPRAKQLQKIARKAVSHAG
jgi:hypothetical protein